MNLVELLRAFGADESLIALAERWLARQDDGTWPDGVEAMTDDEVSTFMSGLIALGDPDVHNADGDEPGDGLIAAAADTAVAVRAEQTARETAAEAAEAQRAQDIARLRGEDPEASEQGGDGEGADGGEGDGAGAGDGEGEGEGGEGGEGGDGGGDGAGAGEGDGAAGAAAEPEPVTAASQRANLGSLASRRRSRAAEPPADLGTEDHLAEIRFAADVPNISAGARVPANRAGMDQVSEAMQRRYAAFARSGSRGGVEEFLPVATLAIEYPEDIRLASGPDGEVFGQDQMARIVARHLSRISAPETISAAGGLCGPPVPYWGVEVLGDDSQPVRDEALVTFGAARGGMISMIPPLLPALAGSNAIWTLDDDVLAASDASHVKSLLTVECGDDRTSFIHAITSRLRYGNIISRTFGEWTQAWADLQMVDLARLSETDRLARVKAGSVQPNALKTQVSATRDVLNYLNRAAWTIRSRNRTLRDFPFRVILPEILLAIMAEDIANGLPGISVDDNLTIAYARIANWFSSRMLNVTWSPDLNVVGGAQAAATDLAALPPAIESAIYPEGTWLRGDAGEIDLGVVRDTVTNAQNNFETFAETFEFVHKLGNESLWLTMNVCPSGAVRGTLDPSGVCASYT